MSGATDFKPVRQAVPDDRQARLAFKVTVLATDGRCLAHDDPAECEGDFQAHHVVTRQQLRHAGREDLSWSPANGITLCEKAHRRHTRAIERFAYDRLPRRCIDFAREHGFLPVLDRFYSR